MKKFNFSLQKILDLRNFELEQAEAELSKANAEVNRIQSSLDAIANQRVNVKNSLEGTTEFEYYVSSQSYFIYLDQKTEAFLNEMAQAQMVAEEKRAVVREAIKKVKVLEKLKETKKKEWKAQNLKDEENQVDDIVTARYNL